MSEYVPKRYPVYTIDDKGRIREYTGIDAYLLLRNGDERRVFKKDLPKGFNVYESFCDYDV
jgi:hypothetical protein